MKNMLAYGDSKSNKGKQRIWREREQGRKKQITIYRQGDGEQNTEQIRGWQFEMEDGKKMIVFE
jgi:hypothetical protein